MYFFFSLQNVRKRLPEINKFYISYYILDPHQNKKKYLEGRMCVICFFFIKITPLFLYHFLCITQYLFTFFYRVSRGKLCKLIFNFYKELISREKKEKIQL